jgi:endonuclease G
MKKLFIFLVFGLNCIISYSWTQRTPEPTSNCAIHNPYGFPVAKPDTQTICRQAYFVGYDSSAKIPRYVTYNLEPEHALGCVVRTNAFAADQSIKDGATPADYIGTGYDKGHMSPDGDLSWDTQVEFESFLMTNMSPQAGSLNRGIWKLLETSVRGWVVQGNQSYTIYVGGLYNATDKKIGKGIIVPHSFYKIVINNQTHEIAGWLFPHVSPYPNLGNDLTKFRVLVSNIESQANIKFAFPTDKIELETGKEWQVDFGSLTKTKHNKCGNATDD